MHGRECFAPTSARWRRDPDAHARNQNRTILRWIQIINVGVKHSRTTDRNGIAMRECLTLSAVFGRDSDRLAVGQRADMTRWSRLPGLPTRNPIDPNNGGLVSIAGQYVAKRSPARCCGLFHVASAEQGRAAVSAGIGGKRRRVRAACCFAQGALRLRLRVTVGAGVQSGAFRLRHHGGRSRFTPASTRR
jgi:hypothetical protein